VFSGIVPIPWPGHPADAGLMAASDLYVLAGLAILVATGVVLTRGRGRPGIRAGPVLIQHRSRAASRRPLSVPAGNQNGDVSLRSLVLGTNTSCLDVPGASTAQGVALQIWTCNGTVAQRFFARNA
jgi:hypothetical protein